MNTEAQAFINCVIVVSGVNSVNSQRSNWLGYSTTIPKGVLTLLPCRHGSFLKTGREFLKFGDRKTAFLQARVEWCRLSRCYPHSRSSPDPENAVWNGAVAFPWTWGPPVGRGAAELQGPGKSVTYSTPTACTAGKHSLWQTRNHAHTWLSRHSYV